MAVNKMVLSLVAIPLVKEELVLVSRFDVVELVRGILSEYKWLCSRDTRIDYLPLWMRLTGLAHESPSTR